MKTAVEWLIDEMNSIKGSSTNMNGKIQFLEKELNKLYEQANKMFEEQIINAASDHCYPTGELARIDAEDYYNETFKSE
jgi:hypothetical protein